ncbi:hypothetical protein B0T18DRAFT_451858 [Schizothecium vesticola]|uniref:Uncharacterized protein n=1 Tax=Schizothecium vesticola TaxID=314040 RepID=A0AA40F8Y2_9PEZI|nr:hypothetical protein B0T18DRAFT_451858 [Schizothecium vesticola]
MMDAPALFAEVQADTDDYLLDLDADPGADDFDFKLDGVYDNGTVDALLETGGEPDAHAHDDLEIGGNDQETQAAIAQEEYAEANEEAQDRGADASIEYQDEIGYEDDESALPDVTNTTTEEAREPHPEQSADIQDVHGQQDVSEHHEEAYVDEQSVADENDENKAPDALDGSLQQEDAAGQDEDDDFQDNDDGGPGAVDSTRESTHHSELGHGRTPASNTDDFENADSDASDSSTMDLDIVVHYNQGQYALVGDPTADPDTYFFSDETVLTRPLSHFLASIRTVLSDEVSAGDELCIRVESLDFEFGEKSSKKFLDRSFFDIIKCFVGLAGNSRLTSKDSSTLNLALMVRRDSEDHFCELLTGAGLAHDEGGEDVDEASSGDEAHDESPVGEDPEGYDLEPDTAGATAEGEDDVERNGGGVEMYFEEAFEDMDDTMGDPFDLEMGMPEPTEQPDAEAGDEQTVEAQHRDEDQQDGHGGADVAGHEERATADEPGDDDVDFSADLGGELAAEPTNEESELAGDAPDQAEEAVNNDWYEEAGAGEDVGVEEVNATNPAGAATEQGSTQNGNTPSFLHSTTLEPSTHQATQSSWREADEDLIDYTDDDEPILPATHSSGKRKPPTSAQDVSPKRRKLETSRWAVESWSVEDSEVHESSYATCSLSTSNPLEISIHSPCQRVETTGQPEEEEEELYDYDDEDDFPASPPPASSPPQATADSTGHHLPNSAVSPFRSSSSPEQARTSRPPTWKSLDNFLAPHDVDFGFTLDPESGLSTTLDEHADVGTALEDDLRQTSMSNSHLVTNEPNGIGFASIHTSRTSTVIGDEVETQGYSLLYSTFDDAQHGTESQGDRDEIDWENDGEENEEQPPVAQTQTINSPSGKRTRTNEPESLDEEADYKRRRT